MIAPDLPLSVLDSRLAIEQSDSVTTDQHANEIGVATARGRPVVPHHEVEQMLSDLSGDRVVLGDNVIAHSSPLSCPACGSSAVIWGCDDRIHQTKEQIHPLVWHATEWMADSFVCGSCWAGWIEPDEPEPITWVRPYWPVNA